MADDLVPQTKGRAALTPPSWEVAWEEFGRRCPRLKHGAVVFNWVLFNGLGQSLVTIFSYLKGWSLPWWWWVLVLLATNGLWQAFTSHYSGEAYRKKICAYETPNLDILFDESDDRFIYPFQFEVAGIQYDGLLFKVGIVSTTAD